MHRAGSLLTAPSFSRSLMTKRLAQVPAVPVTAQLRQLTVTDSLLSFNLAAIVPCTRSLKSLWPFFSHLRRPVRVYPRIRWESGAITPVLTRAVTRCGRQPRLRAGGRTLIQPLLWRCAPCLPEPGGCSCPRGTLLVAGVTALRPPRCSEARGWQRAAPLGLKGRSRSPRGAAADKGGRRHLRLPRTPRRCPGTGAAAWGREVSPRSRAGEPRRWRPRWRCRAEPGRAGRRAPADRPPAPPPRPAGWLRARRTWRRRWGGTLYLSTGPTASAGTAESSSSSKGAPAGGDTGGRGARAEGGPAPAAARFCLSLPTARSH